MANPEHVRVVQQGAEAIAAWRDTHPGERLDLEKADLAGADLRAAGLRGANLHAACLREANLTGADLQHAHLRAASLVGARLPGARLQHAHLVRANLEKARLPRARLQRAHLHGAHLQEADLHEANLQRAHLLWAYLVGAHLGGSYLEQADLQWANLQGVNLTGARLQEANLQEVVVGDTAFIHTNLHGARGLDTCRHQSVSPLDAGTLAQSGPLPAGFLRGCGWSEELIAGISGHVHVRPLHLAVERTIVLPATSHQVGLGLLAYFGTLLRQQHPDMPATLRLEQTGWMVRLLVDIPAGWRDTVEQTLQAYGLVVAGHTSPDAWLADPAHAQQLHRQLAIAETALRLTHDLLPQPERPAVPLSLPAPEAFRRLRQMVGNALCDL
jgi:uncharacterized protein YjbI with pentapeptide repeats